MVIAPGRAARPGATRPQHEPPSEAELAGCPFCEGREDRTPPEVLALPPREPADSPGWRVRVVPNLYPAFEHQEVVVHSPRHVSSFADLSDEEIDLVAAAWQARWSAAVERDYSYLHALVNEGREAGASLAHSHSQLLWLREPPPAVLGERAGGVAALRTGASALEIESLGDAMALCHPAGRTPYETLIAGGGPGGWESPELPSLLLLLRNAVRRLRAIEGAVPWNAWLHAGEELHLELVPRLTVFAGVELGAGIWVNTLAPEEAAARLRAAEL